MGILEWLGRNHTTGKVEGGAVPFEVFLTPHGRDDLDRLFPSEPAGLPIDVEGRLLHRRGPTSAPLDAATREDVGSRHLLGDSGRMDEAVRQQGDPEAQADVFCRLGERPNHHLGCRAVRPTLSEVVLDEPGDVETDLVGEAHLFEHLPIGPLLTFPLGVGMGLVARRPRRVDLIEQIQLHSALPSVEPMLDPQRNIDIEDSRGGVSTVGHVQYRVNDGIATITFNRPEKRNAITFAMLDTWIEHLDRAAGDGDVRVVVLDGAGSTFTSGVDVGERPDLQDPAQRTLQEDEAEIVASAERWSRLWSLPKPVIVKARGYCVGWGLEIALYADFVLASKDCQFFFPSVRNGSGLPDSTMAIYHLGPQWSKRLLLTGDAIDGVTAARIGLVLEALPDEELDAGVDDLAGRLAAVPPLMAESKRVINRAIDLMGRPQLQEYALTPMPWPGGTRMRPSGAGWSANEDSGKRSPGGKGGVPSRRSEVRRPLLHEGPGSFGHLRGVDQPAGELGAVLQRRPLQVE